MAQIISNIDELSEILIKEIHQPVGWELAEEQPHISFDNLDIQTFTERVNKLMPGVTQTVNTFIDLVWDRLSMQFTGTELSIEPDGGLHLHFFMDQVDYLSPKLAAVKLFAEQYFDSHPSGYRHHFYNGAEHNKTYMLPGQNRIRYIRVK